MGQYVDLLRSLPKARRDLSGRKADKSLEVITTSKQFGREYFDGDRKYGYGGYHHDGRWLPVAEDIIEHYSILEGRVLDVGCAKGFLVNAFEMRGVDAYGIDVSRYAVVTDPRENAVGRLHLGSADALPFPDQSFDLVLSINTLHNLPRPRLIKALQEMQRVSWGGAFVQVDAYRTEAERALFEDWVLTAETHGTPEFWLELFAEAGYEGDYCWTIVEGT
jgi:SAM-dependent methyltransferase